MYIQLFSRQLSTSSSAFLRASSKPSNGSFVAGNFIRSVDFSISNKFPMSLTCSASCSQLLRCVLAFRADETIMLARPKASTPDDDGGCGKLAMLLGCLEWDFKYKCFCMFRWVSLFSVLVAFSFSFSSFSFSSFLFFIFLFDVCFVMFWNMLSLFTWGLCFEEGEGRRKITNTCPHESRAYRNWCLHCCGVHQQGLSRSAYFCNNHLWGRVAFVDHGSYFLSVTGLKLNDQIVGEMGP